MIQSVLRRPLFYAAILLSLVLTAEHYFPVWSNRVPQNDISRFAAEGPAEIFLGGVIVSEVEKKRTFFGELRASFVLKAAKAWPAGGGEGSSVKGRVKVYLRDPKKNYAYGDEVVLKGQLRIPKGLRNPGGFDLSSYLDRQGIRALFYGEKNFEHRLLRRGRGNPILAKAIKAKRFLSRSLSREFNSRDAAFLQALFLGERSGLEEDFKDLFIKTGTMHILAVSGFNIGFLGLTLFFLLKPFPFPINVKFILALAAVWAYCLLVGWQAPVVRASLMATVFILGKLVGRKTDALNALGLAALIILAVSPKQLFDVGFQLSFLAVFAIIAFVPRFYKKPELLPNERWTPQEKTVFYLKELFWVSFVCIVVTLPVTVQNFYIVTPYALLANLIVVPLAFLLFFAGVIFFLTFWWLPSFLAAVPAAMKAMMAFFVQALYLIENLPGATVIIGKLHPVLWAMLTAGIALLLFYPKIKKPVTRAFSIALIAVVIFLAQDIVRYFNRSFKMTALDVGQGDAIYFEFPEGGNLLVDAGKGGDSDQGRWVVAPFLRSKGVRSIDTLVVSHPQEDHIGGMPTVLEEFKVKNVVEPGRPYETKLHERLWRRIKRERARTVKADAGSRLEDFEGVSVFILHPDQETEAHKNINDESVVLKIVYGKTSFLLTGDIGEQAARDILGREKSLKADVLKVPHHGAKLGPQGELFLRAVNPKISVISAGERNPYRHPSPKTLAALEAIPGNKIYRTDESGAIEIVSDGFRLDVRRQLS